MRKILVNLLSCFIPSRKGRHDFRSRFAAALPARSVDPWAVLAEDNDITIAEADKRNVSLGIQGKNNTVIIGKLAEGCPGSINIFLAGNNCTVIFEENIFSLGLFSFYVLISQETFVLPHRLFRRN